MQNHVMEQLYDAAKRLPKKQAAICEYIYEHPMEASAMNAAELAEHLHVGTATVTRLIGRLGFTNYPDFRKALRRAVVLPAKATYSSFWETRLELLNVRNSDTNNVYKTILEQTIEWVQELNDSHMFKKLDYGVQMILQARKIGVLGLRSARSLALTFVYSLHNSMDNIIPLCEDSEYVIDTVADMDRRDLVIFYATAPYVTRTGEIARLCKALGIPTILITTNRQEESSLSIPADLILSTGEDSAVATYIPQLLITELLTKRLNVLCGKQARDKLLKLDQILDQNGLKIWEMG